MKKIILSIAIIAGLITMTNLQAINATAPSVMNVLQDNGFVDVENLSEEVQASINALTEEYDITSLKYNSEQQLTKVELLKKDDQSSETIFFNASGEKVQKDSGESEQQSREREQQQNELEQQPPLVEIYFVNDGDGYANVKFEDLNENVQNAIRAIIGDWEISSIMYNSEKGHTKVAATNKEDQTEKTFYFDNEGNEFDKGNVQSSEELEEETQLPIG